ncbi:7903_t:CDS:2, partial [Gigaspora rosea]
ELEKILKEKKENQKKFLDKLKKFPEIKDSLTYINIGHIFKEKEKPFQTCNTSICATGLINNRILSENYNNGYNRFDLGDIANNIVGNANAKGAYNVIFIKNLIHKLAVSCFDYDRYILYEIHKNDLTSYFPSDFNRGARRKRQDWESVEDDPTTILLDKNNFSEEMKVHFTAAHNEE